jgi:hypothetical protein
MNGAKDAPQQSRIPRVFLEFDKIEIQAREIFITFDQKFPNSLLIFRTNVVHDPLLVRVAAGLSLAFP